MKTWEELLYDENRNVDFVEVLTRSLLGRACLGLTVQYDDVVSVISSATDAAQETREQVLASITHIASPGEMISYFAFCMHMAELKEVIEDEEGYRAIIKAMGDSGDKMPISKPPEQMH